MIPAWSTSPPFMSCRSESNCCFRYTGQERASRACRAASRCEARLRCTPRPTQRAAIASPGEKADLESWLRFSAFVDLMHAEARCSLKKHDLAVRNQSDALSPAEKQEVLASGKEGGQLSILKSIARRTLGVKPKKRTAS
jgi:hypothetical protein